MEFVLHRFNQIGKLFPEQAGSAIGRMTGGNGIDAVATRHPANGGAGLFRKQFADLIKPV